MGGLGSFAPHYFSRSIIPLGALLQHPCRNHLSGDMEVTKTRLEHLAMNWSDGPKSCLERDMEEGGLCSSLRHQNKLGRTEREQRGA